MKRKWLHDSTTSLSGAAYRFIEEQIVTLRLKPGDAINDAEVAEQLGVSRTPVREALLRLEDDGLVEWRPAAGSSWPRSIFWITSIYWKRGGSWTRF